MNVTIAKLALTWIAAERKAAEARGEAWDEIPKEDEIAVAADRVYQVMSGDVRWSNCSPGDKAIWKGRFRDLEVFEKIWAKHDPDWKQDLEDDGDLPRTSPRRGRARRAAPDPRNYPGPGGRNPLPIAPLPEPSPYAGLAQGDNVAQPAAGQFPRSPRLIGYRERRHEILYDTLTCEETAGPLLSFRLFNNRNIGDAFLTNLQVGGQMSGDMTAVVMGLWVSLSELAALRHAADHYLVTFVIGDRPQFGPLHVRELFQGIWLRRPLIIPVRQNFGARIERKSTLPAGLEPFELVVHLDCLMTRDVA